MMSDPSPGAHVRRSAIEIRRDLINREICPILRVHIHTSCFVCLLQFWVILGCSGLLKDISPYGGLSRVDGLMAGSSDGE